MRGRSASSTHALGQPRRIVRVGPRRPASRRARRARRPASSARGRCWPRSRCAPRRRAPLGDVVDERHARPASRQRPAQLTTRLRRTVQLDRPSGCRPRARAGGRSMASSTSSPACVPARAAASLRYSTRPASASTTPLGWATRARRSSRDPPAPSGAARPAASTGVPRPGGRSPTRRRTPSRSRRRRRPGATSSGDDQVAGRSRGWRSGHANRAPPGVLGEPAGDDVLHLRSPMLTAWSPIRS